jgi:hypothetical protein
MDAIGGDTPKSLQVAEPDEPTFVPTVVRVQVCNPHSVVIGDVVVEVRDGKVHVTPSPAGELDVVFHEGGPDVAQ